MTNENLNIHVFTTRFVIKENSPILKVYHDDDGDWQFIGKETNLKEMDAMVVSLEEILNFDPSLKQLLSLPIGSMAYRLDQYSEWIFEK
jgi:hypothetical protein